MDLNSFDVCCIKIVSIPMSCQMAALRRFHALSPQFPAVREFCREFREIGGWGGTWPGFLPDQSAAYAEIPYVREQGNFSTPRRGEVRKFNDPWQPVRWWGRNSECAVNRAISDGIGIG